MPLQYNYEEKLKSVTVKVLFGENIAKQEDGPEVLRTYISSSPGTSTL